MKRMMSILLALIMLLSLCGCKPKEEAPVPDGPVSSAPQQGEKAPEGLVTVTGEAFTPTELKSVSASAAVTQGRNPAWKYDLPEKVVSMQEWVSRGGNAMLAELKEADAAFYAIEGKEYSPALIRWGDSLAEFSWRYVTPRGISPRMWCFDFDSDGADELVVDCYYGSGTGVSLSDLHVVEKNADGTLSAYTFPADLLITALEGGLGVVTEGEKVYAYLGTELAEITKALEGKEPSYINSGLAVGETIEFVQTETGMRCRMGIVVSAEKLYHWYVTDLAADIVYKDGKFILDELHLEGY